MSRLVTRTTRRGVTVLQLLAAIAVVIVVSSLVISRVVADKRARYTEAMKADLLRVAAAESAYAAANHRYARDTAALGIRPSPKVTIAIAGAGLDAGTGWSATAEHAFVDGRRCVIGAGTDTAFIGLAKAGEVVRTKPGVVRCVDEER